MHNNGDRFFEQTREVFSDFSPEVPQAVYTGMRKKLFWSNFMSFSFTSLNIWYVALLAGGVTAGFIMKTDTNGVSADTNAPFQNSDVRDVTTVVSDLQTEAPVEMASLTVTEEPTTDIEQNTERSSVMASNSEESHFEAAQASEINSTEVIAETRFEEVEQTMKEVVAAEELTETAQDGINEEVATEVVEEEIELPLHLDKTDEVAFDIKKQLKEDKGELVIDLKVKIPADKEKK